jgi:hypothetical protein
MNTLGTFKEPKAFKVIWTGAVAQMRNKSTQILIALIPMSIPNLAPSKSFGRDRLSATKSKEVNRIAHLSCFSTNLKGILERRRKKREDKNAKKRDKRSVKVAYEKERRPKERIFTLGSQ